MGEIAEAVRLEIVKALIESVPRTLPKIPPPPPGPAISEKQIPQQEKKVAEERKTPKVLKERVVAEVKPTSWQLINGVDIEVYKYFKQSPSTIDRLTQEQLQKVFNWATEGKKDIGRALNRIRDVEMRIGKRNEDGVVALRKVYNDIRIKELKRG